MTQASFRTPNGLYQLIGFTLATLDGICRGQATKATNPDVVRRPLNPARHLSAIKVVFRTA